MQIEYFPRGTLLRQARSIDGKMIKFTLACLSNWSADDIEELKRLLFNKRQRPWDVDARWNADVELMQFLLSRGVPMWKITQAGLLKQMPGVSPQA